VKDMPVNQLLTCCWRYTHLTSPFLPSFCLLLTLSLSEKPYLNTTMPVAREIFYSPESYEKEKALPSCLFLPLSSWQEGCVWLFFLSLGGGEEAGRGRLAGQSFSSLFFTAANNGTAHFISSDMVADSLAGIGVSTWRSTRYIRHLNIISGNLQHQQQNDAWRYGGSACNAAYRNAAAILKLRRTTWNGGKNTPLRTRRTITPRCASRATRSAHHLPSSTSRAACFLLRLADDMAFRRQNMDGGGSCKEKRRLFCLALAAPVSAALGRGSAWARRHPLAACVVAAIGGKIASAARIRLGWAGRW